MSAGIPSNLAPLAHTFTVADMNDVDGIKTSIATATSPIVYSGVTLNGAWVYATGGLKWAPRTLTVSTSSSVGAYTTASPIVVTGTRGGAVATENLALTQTGGNQTIRGSQPFDTITSISVPAMSNTAGAFTFGVGDICAFRGSKLAFKALSAGYVRCRFDSAGLHDDSFSVGAGVREDLVCERILTSSALTNPTAVDLTVYFLG